jgi:hypothetical protein
MAIDIQSLFNPGSLQQMGETEDEKKKRAQITGTMNVGGQSGTFNGNFDPSLFQQQTNNSASVGYQPPPNYGMKAPPEQQPVPVIQPPAPPPMVGTSPISGEFSAPPPQPAPLPPGNQPYVAPPAEPYQAPPPEQYGGGFRPEQPLQQDDFITRTQEMNRVIQQQQQERFDALPQDEQQRQLDAQKEFLSQQQQTQQQIFGFGQPVDFGPGLGNPPASNPVALGPSFWELTNQANQQFMQNNQDLANQWQQSKYANPNDPNDLGSFMGYLSSIGKNMWDLPGFNDWNKTSEQAMSAPGAPIAMTTNSGPVEPGGFGFGVS